MSNEFANAILVIGPESSRCSNCGFGASPNDKSHISNPTWRAPAGDPCGALFTALATIDGGNVKANAASAKGMRPDLQFVGAGLFSGMQFSIHRTPEDIDRL